MSRWMSCQHLQALVVAAQRAIGVMPLCHIALNAEVSGDTSLLVVEAEVVAFNRNGVPSTRRSSVSMCSRPLSKKLRQMRRPYARSCPKRSAGVVPRNFSRVAPSRQHRVVDLCDTLVLEDVVERLLFVDRVVPDHRLVEHHEEKTVQRLRKKQLQAIVGFHGVRSRERQWRKQRSSYVRFSRRPERAVSLDDFVSAERHLRQAAALQEQQIGAGHPISPTRSTTSASSPSTWENPPRPNVLSQSLWNRQYGTATRPPAR